MTSLEPIHFPKTEGEIVIFPRKYSAYRIELYKLVPHLRTRNYRSYLAQIARNARRFGRGENSFIIVPSTFEKLLDALSQGPSKQREEVARVLEEMYFRGKTTAETGCQVNKRTLIRNLQKAELVADILGDLRDNPFRISLKTISISYVALRLGRDAGIDIRRYFGQRIF